MNKSDKNLIKRITNSLLNILIVLFGIVLIVSVYTILQTKVFKKEYNDFFGYSMFEVQTGSMKKEINPGDWIIVKLTNDIKLNDVVTYKFNGEFITHRVIEVTSDSYVTRGDANTQKDNPIKKNQVIGKVVGNFRNLGLIRQIVFNPFVIMALIITVFLFGTVFKEEKQKEIVLKKVKDIYGQIKQKLLNKKPKEQIIYETKEETENNDRDIYRKIKEAGGLEDFDTVEDEKTEEELSKTAHFRILSVNSDEETDLSNYQTEIKEEPKIEEEDLSKTSVFRIISVDKEEINNTLLEAAQVELKDEVIVKKEIEKPLEEEIIETLTDIDLNLIDNKETLKMGKNIIETVLNLKKDELDKIIEILVKYDEDYINKPTLKNSFMEIYLDARYYNTFTDGTVIPKKSIIRIRQAIEDYKIKLINTYKGKDKKYDLSVKKYSQLFTLIANLENANDLVDGKAAKDELYHREIKKYQKKWQTDKVNHLIKHINIVQKFYLNQTSEFLKTFETNMFNLKNQKLDNYKDMFVLDLEHNITFSKVYSDYIIDKTYQEGIIAEDKVSILLSLLSLELINDMYLANYKNKYILYIPGTLYKKEKKLEKVLKLIDNKYAIENTIILLHNNELMANKNAIKKLYKKGFKFGLILSSEKISKKELYLTNYIFVNRKQFTIKKVKEIVPKEMINNVIYDDILDKLNDVESE